uniref:Serine/arginine repetitive matrix protein 3-like n=1 Tax=Tursiops truncatus TaxID=9739 RepID=A0A6J3RYI6_TURTR|nr:serine/arginine repetitive matrix protein 3-like [Tursiops truncatus]
MKRQAASPAGQPRHRDAGPLTSPDSPGNELFNNLRREESPRSPRLGGHQARPGSAGAPPSPSPRPALGSAKGARARAGGLLLPLRPAVRSSVRGPGAGKGAGTVVQSPIPLGTHASPALGARLPWPPARLPLRSTPRRAGPGLLETPVCGRGGRRPPSKARQGREQELEAAGAGPRQPDQAAYDSSTPKTRSPRSLPACFVASEPSRSFSKTTWPRGQYPVSGKAAPQELKPQDRAREAPDPQAGREAVNAGAERKLTAGPRSEPRLAGRWSFPALRKADYRSPFRARTTNAPAIECIIYHRRSAR